MKPAVYATATSAALLLVFASGVCDEISVQSVQADCADVSDTVRTVCDESADYEFGGTCPAGCQDALDTMYGFCGGTCLGSEMDSVGIECDSMS